MAEAPKPGPDVVAETEAPVEGANIDSALNSGELNQLIFRYNQKHDGERPLGVEDGDDERYKKLVEIHKNVKTVSKNVRQFLLTELAADKVKMSATDFNGENGDIVEDFLIERATDDLEAAPSALEQIQNKLVEYYKTREKIKFVQEEIGRRTKELASFQREAGGIQDMPWWQRVAGGVFGGKEAREAQRHARSRGIKVGFGGGVDQSQGVAEREAWLRAADRTLSGDRLTGDNLEKQANEMRVDLLRELGTETGILSKAMQIATERMNKMLTSESASFSQAEEAYDQFDSIDEVDEESEANYLPQGVDRDRLREARARLDDTIKEKVFVEMSKAIDGASLGKGQLDAMEKFLITFAKTHPQIGAERTAEQSQAFILSTLKLIYDRLDVKDSKQHIKRLLVARACSKMDPKVDIDRYQVSDTDSYRIDSYEMRQDQAAKQAAPAAPAAPSAAPASSVPSVPGPGPSPDSSNTYNAATDF